MPRLTGKAGAATLGGTAVVLNGWEFEARSNNIETPAAGDIATDRTHLRTDWTATVRCFLPVTPPYNTHLALVGTDAAVALKFLDSDLNPAVTDTGLVESVRVVHNHDAATEVEVTIISSDGSAGPTYDESPAT